MRLSKISRLLAGLPRRLKGFSANRDGIAAVEFALIVPLMGIMFAGAVEMSQAITAYRHVNMFAGTVGDLNARKDTTITDSDISDSMTVGSYLMSPFSATTATVTVKLVGSSASDATKTITEWTCSYTGSSPSTVSCSCPWTTVTIPTGLVTTSDYVLVTNVSYGYKPPLFDFYMKSGYGGAVNGVYTMTAVSYNKPRATVPQLSINSASPCVLK